MPAVPNCDRSIVDPLKISGYLLSRDHPTGRTKSRFFMRFGFREDAPEELAAALLLHVQHNPVTDIEVSVYGTKYRVEGALLSPDGRSPLLTSVWMVRRGEAIPRFVTAFPC